MRKSPQRHPLAILRLIIGLGQKEMATLLKCSRPTIQAIELGNLKLSERIAHEAAIQTGISLQWLLNGKPEDQPISRWNAPYTIAEFDATQAELARPRTDETDCDFIFDFYLQCVSRIGGAMVQSVHNDQYRLFAYKANQLLEEIENQFGTCPLLDEELRMKIDCAMSELPPYSPTVTDPIHEALQNIITEKQKQERLAQRKARPSSKKVKKGKSKKRQR